MGKGTLSLCLLNFAPYAYTMHSKSKAKKTTVVISNNGTVYRTRVNHPQQHRTARMKLTNPLGRESSQTRKQILPDSIYIKSKTDAVKQSDAVENQGKGYLCGRQRLGGARGGLGKGHARSRDLRVAHTGCTP